jgi:hypothetical protein
MPEKGYIKQQCDSVPSVTAVTEAKAGCSLKEMGDDACGVWTGVDPRRQE